MIDSISAVSTSNAGAAPKVTRHWVRRVRVAVVVYLARRTAVGRLCGRAFLSHFGSLTRTCRDLFSVLFTQSPSFLAHQRSMHLSKGKCNASTIFGLTDIPTCYHSAITPVIVSPGSNRAISLEPQFIRPQDGAAKQDCENAAAKRWLKSAGLSYAERGVTIHAGDL